MPAVMRVTRPANGGTSSPLRLLLLEDNEAHGLILEHELRRGGLTFVQRRVDDLAEMRRALETGVWDAVISDYALPGFSALEALAAVKESGLDLPFIVISAFIDEDAAVTLLRAGAHDFVLKGNLARLAPAIEREIADARGRAELRRVQNELTVSDRMASLGMVAAGIAHEMNNPIAALVANVEHARELCAAMPGETPALHRLLACLADVNVAAERIGNVVRDIEVFSRGTALENTDPLDVHQVLDSSVRLAWNHIHRRARLVKDYGHVPAVSGTESRLGQVFVNLLVNAAQAIDEGQADLNQIRLTTSREDGNVRIDVQDTGAGMPPEVLERIFTPFFSTKRAGSGTGLGLAICRRILSSLGGEIRIASSLGQGTTVSVLLPAAARHPQTTAQPPRLDRA
jgi:C4-dicarboxylate-specific signal transduction histidine kinase